MLLRYSACAAALGFPIAPQRLIKTLPHLQHFCGNSGVRPVKDIIHTNTVSRSRALGQMLQPLGGTFSLWHTPLFRHPIVQSSIVLPELTNLSKMATRWTQRGTPYGG